MKLAVAADHGGYPLKARVIRDLTERGHQVVDLGTNSTDPVDYPDYARFVAEAILQGLAERAILICGSGAGACVAANKFAGIRAATCHDSFSAHQAVEDDDVNVMCMGARGRAGAGAGAGSYVRECAVFRVGSACAAAREDQGVRAQRR